MVDSFIDFALVKLLMSILIFRITSCPNSFAANGQLYTCSESPKANFSRIWGVWIPPPCVLSFHICPPVGSLSPLPQPLHSCLLRGCDWVWPLVHGVRKLCPFWEDNSRRERHSWFSGFLGSRDVFVCAYAGHSELEKSEIRPCPCTSLQRSGWDWGALRRWWPVGEAGRECLWMGTGAEGVKWRVYVLVTRFSSTSSLASCNHTRSVAGCACVLQSSPAFPGL